jgi:hypothetical protein
MCCTVSISLQFEYATTALLRAIKELLVPGRPNRFQFILIASG